MQVLSENYATVNSLLLIL